jgi:hypothetical protein
MGFNRLAGDQLLEDRDPELAAEIRREFMSYYVPLAGDLYVSRYQDQPRIVVYVRSDGPVLRIAGPEPHQEWTSPPWFGDAGEALTFAGDAGVAAGTDSLPPVGVME